MEAGPLNAQNLFNLADLLLDLAGRRLDGAFVFQIWIIGSLSRLLLDLALHFVKLAFRLVFGTWFHGIFLLKVLNDFVLRREHSGHPGISLPLSWLLLRPPCYGQQP